MAYERYESEDEDGCGLDVDGRTEALAIYFAETERMDVLIKIALAGLGYQGAGVSSPSELAARRLSEMLARSQKVDG